MSNFSNQRCWHRSSSALVTVMTMLLMAPAALALDKTWTLFHSLNGGQDFSRRASVLLSVDPETDGVEMTITNDNSTLNKESYLAAKATGSLYQLKLEEGDNKKVSNSEGFILSSVPGCQLLRSSFRDEIVVTLGPKASAISLTYIPLVSPLAPKSCDHEVWDTKFGNDNLPEGWESRISWETATPGMVLRPTMPQFNPPPGLKWLPRMAQNGKIYQAQGPPGTGEKGGEGGGKGGGGPGGPDMDNTPLGFIKRYWYILLPILIMNFMGGGAPEPEGQAGSAAGGAPAVEGGAAATPTTSPGGASKQRRGKRG